MAQEAIIDGNLINDARPLAVEQQGVANTAIICAAGDIHAPAANTAAVVTYPAPPALSHVITGVAWSYSGGIPVGGRLTVVTTTHGTVFDIDIAEEGAGAITFPVPKMAAPTDVMTVTLAAGGAAITGKVNVLSHWVE
jgi:hypothetical protein